MDDYGMTPLEGGYSGETFLGDALGERTVVRIYAARGAERGPTAVEVDAAVLRLVRGLLPVPEVLEVRRPDPASGTPALLVTSYLPGVRLDLVLPRLTPEQRETVGTGLAEILARLAQMPMTRIGMFVDGDLRIEPWGGFTDLAGFVESIRPGTALESWSERDYAALLGVADEAQALVDDVDRACLVHSDFNPKNLLVDPETLEVTGVLDWEFAHSGLPGTDLGNLLRFERDPAFAEAVLATYSERVPDADESLLVRARARDLYAVVELASRRGQNPVADRAHEQLLAIARAGSLHAEP